MRQYIEIRGYRIAVHAKTGTQAKWYRDNYALLSNSELAIKACETALDDSKRASNTATQRRHNNALQRRAAFYVV